MGKKKDDTSDTAITEENTAPDAAEDTSPADAEVGTSDVNFTTADGTAEAPASSSDGMDTPSTDSITSPSSDAGAESPLASGGIGESSDAPDASKSDTGSDDATSTEEDDKSVGVVTDLPMGATDKTGDQDAKESLKGEHADGEGATHVGTDTPEKLVSNPYNEDTGEPLFKEDTRSKEPLSFDSFKDKKDDDGKAKLGQAIELLTEVGDKL